MWRKTTIFKKIMHFEFLFQMHFKHFKIIDLEKQEIHMLFPLYLT